MLSKEDIQLLSGLMDEKLKPIQQDISEMKEDIEFIKEDMREVRTTVEEICKWIDLNFDYKYPFPIDKNVG